MTTLLTNCLLTCVGGGSHFKTDDDGLDASFLCGN